MVGAVVAVIMAFTVLPMLFTGYSNAQTIQTDFTVADTDEFQDAATLTGINVTDAGTIKLDDTATTGTYESQVVDRDTVVTLIEAVVDVVEASSTSTVDVTVETSNDNFTTVDESVSEQFTSSGTKTVNLTEIDGDQFRVTLDLSRSADTDPNPEVSEYSVEYEYEAGETIGNLLTLVLVLTLLGVGVGIWRKVN